MKRVGVVATVAAGALLLPAAASAHAYLTHTAPAASVVLNSAPGTVSLTFDEAVEPRFAIISVADAAAHQEATASPQRSASDPNTLFVPIKHVPEGWYLVYWRAISVDGHPVQGAFTFAVGPNAGPPPDFSHSAPHISQTATTTPLLIARWLMFLTTMTAIGLFVLRIAIARPVVTRAVSIAFGVASVASLIAFPAYLEELTSIDSLRGFWDVGALVPLWRTTAFGRGYVDMWTCFALFVAAAAIAIRIDRPERKTRPVAPLLALIGASLAAAATLALPGVSGHAGQTSPRGWSVLLDWLHLVSGSIWIGGLVGLLVLWRSLGAERRVVALAVAVPRFSTVALVSVLLLLATGVGASVIHLPTVDALWLTSYGKTILVKAGILLAAVAVASVNLFRVKPALGKGTARLLRSTVSTEVVLVAGAIAAAAVLSSLAPPPPAFAEEGKALVRVGPGQVAATASQAGYKLQVLVAPNKAVASNSFVLRLTRNGKPVTGASVSLTFAMLDMQMPNQEYQLAETAPGVYTRKAPALVMVGHWGLSFAVTPKGGTPFTALVVDRAAG
ncbi:MAG TPA: copper resistance protein CopC [Gaiellaceae bacterium]|nr:copper resistance protein CopC [Gaiellaceae bacterium]